MKESFVTRHLYLRHLKLGQVNLERVEDMYQLSEKKQLCLPVVSGENVDYIYNTYASFGAQLQQRYRLEKAQQEGHQDGQGSEERLRDLRFCGLEKTRLCGDLPAACQYQEYVIRLCRMMKVGGQQITGRK